MPDQIEDFKVICEGGLNSNENHLDLSENMSGAATRLVNYEPSLYGGYRRIQGYTDLGEVGEGTAEGKVLCICIFRNERFNNPYLIAARQDIGANTYSFYRYVPFVGWEIINTGLTRNMSDGLRSVDKVRFAQFDFGSGDTVVFVDGVNNAVIFDGIYWKEINNTNTGDAASPGGDQALNAPSVVDVFRNHVFLSGDAAYPGVVVNSAPEDPFNWTVAAGAGQMPMGFTVVQIKPFRDDLFVFGRNSIKKINVDLTAGFVVDQVTANVGCVAKDSVLEIGGDLMFLAPDGLRPVAGTSRIGDVELESVSRAIQVALVNMIDRYDLSTLNGVVIRGKSQVRYFIGDDSTNAEDSYGIVGGLTQKDSSISWEFGELLGIRASCCTSDYYGTTEYVLHGDYDGRVYRQEQGNSFAGRDITAVYATPYLDFGDTQVRKVIRKINTFVRAEGPFTLNLSVSYDWGDFDTARPSAYAQSSTGGPVAYAGINIQYGGPNVQYGGNSKPIMVTDIQGSGFAVRATFVTVGQFEPHSIQGLVFEYSTAGRR